LEAERQSKAKLKQQLHIARHVIFINSCVANVSIQNSFFRNSETIISELMQVVEEMVHRISSSITRLTSVISAEKDLAQGKVR
jgi:hypothetical protein